MHTPDDDEDFNVDDITRNLDKKKKIKSKAKGKRGEAEVVTDLNARFKALFEANPEWGQFSRSVGSGNRWGQNVYLPAHAKATFTGDLTCPANFKFVIENKLGYNEIDLFLIFTGKCKELDTFLKQVTDDSMRVSRKPLLVWKKDRKDRVAFLHRDEVEDLPKTNYLFYKEWIGMSFAELMTYEDAFFFDLI